MLPERALDRGKEELHRLLGEVFTFLRHLADTLDVVALPASVRGIDKDLEPRRAEALCLLASAGTSQDPHPAGGELHPLVGDTHLPVGRDGNDEDDDSVLLPRHDLVQLHPDRVSQERDPVGQGLFVPRRLHPWDQSEAGLQLLLDTTHDATSLLSSNLHDSAPITLPL